jgi:hypothetical protein
MPAIRNIILITIVLVLTYGSIAAQTAKERYGIAKKIYEAHSIGDFLHDDSPAAIDALSTMWSSSAGAAIQLLSRNTQASAKDIHLLLCGIDPDADTCTLQNKPAENVLELGPNLFAMSQFTGEAGTVFVVGPSRSGPSLLWSINASQPSEVDPRGLLGAWRADRAGESCRSENSRHPPGTCGPLYASLGPLPADKDGKQRFYVNAGYAQMMGATIGAQTSIWRWDGDNATLLWIDWYDIMIDQKLGTSFADGILGIAEKDEFRSFFSCGSCEARQMLHRLRITSSGIEDLGKASTTPELDLIDELFWRLANHKPTADIASEKVARLLEPQIADAAEDSKKIDPKWFSTGMLGEISIKRIGNIEHLCFTVDGDMGRLYFTIEKKQDKKAMLSEVKQQSGDYGDCWK